MRYLLAFLAFACCFGCGKHERGGDNAALFKAVKDGDVEHVRVLLKSGISAKDLNEWGYNVLAYVRNPEIADLLLLAGADPNYINPRDPDQRTPLHNLCITFDAPPQLIGHLVDAGADVTVKDYYGKTPIDYVSQIVDDFPSDQDYKVKLEILLDRYHQQKVGNP